MSAFSCVVCGIDGSPEAEEAVREVACLAPDGAHLFLVDVVVAARPPATLVPEVATARKVAVLEAAHADLAAARALIRDGLAAAVTVRVGPPGPTLEREALCVGADRSLSVATAKDGQQASCSAASRPG